MKKVLPLLGLLLALAAVIAFKWRRVGGVGERLPASRAAELAPSDAVAFFQLPDLERTGARWPQGDLRALVEELGWTPGSEREAVDELRKYLYPDFMLLLRMLPEIQKAAPAGLFFAATSLADELRPKVVGGFSYRGKRTDLESVVRAVKTQLFAQWPGAKSELFRHDGIEIETITATGSEDTLLPAPPPGPGGQAGFNYLVPVPPGLPPDLPGVPSDAPVDAPAPEVAVGPVPASGAPAAPAVIPPPPPAVFLAYRDDWCFFATDRALLTDTLDRYLRKAGAAKSLAENPLFAECRKHEVPGADVIVWEAWDRKGGKLLPHWPGFSAFWGAESNELQVREWKVSADLLKDDPLGSPPLDPAAGPANPLKQMIFMADAFADYHQNNSTLTVKQTVENLDLLGRFILRRQGITPREPLELKTDVQAAHYSAKLDGPSRLYVQMAKAPVAGGLVNRATALAPPGALAYGTIHLDALRGREPWMEHALLRSTDWSKIGRALEERKLAWDDLWAAFGPDASFFLFDEDGLPRLTVALDVRDPLKARMIGETVMGGTEFSRDRTEGETAQSMQKIEARNEFGVVPSENTGLPAGMVLTRSHLIVGASSPGGIEVAQRSSKVGEPAVKENGAAASVVSGSEPGKGAWFYFDAGRIASAQHLLPSPGSLTFLRRIPLPGEALPLGKIQPKLRAGTLRLHPEGSGWLLESDLSILGSYIAWELMKAAL